MVAAALLLGSGTAIAAPDTVAPVASTAPSDGGTGGEPCAYLPSSLQELLCPTAGGAADETSNNGGGAATSGAGSSSTSSGAAGGTTGTTGTTPTPGASGSGASPPGVVSNFLIWLAGLFQYLGL